MKILNIKMLNKEYQHLRHNYFNDSRDNSNDYLKIQNSDDNSFNLFNINSNNHVIRINIIPKIAQIILTVLLLLPNRISAFSCTMSSECYCEPAPGNLGIVINCNDKKLQKIPSLILKNPTMKIYEITLQGNSIGDIPGYSFNGTDTKRLYLNDNPLTNIDPNAFNGLETSLIELTIGDGSKKLHLNFMDLHIGSLKTLEMLKLSYFKDPNLLGGTLTTLNKLKFLSITNGKLFHIEDNTFDGLADNLEHLDLSLNDLETVPPIKSLKNLKILKLNNNPIHSIAAGVFEGNKNLRELHISSIGKMILDVNSFHGIENSLEVLSMSNNALEDDEINVVYRLKNLVQLDLELNSLKSINNLLDGSMRRLEDLNVAGNQLEGLKDHIGKKIRSYSLKNLKLDINPNLHVEEDSFAELTVLKYLHMDKVGILELGESSFTTQMNTLEILHLNEVKLNQKFWSSLKNLKTLKELSLSYCGIDRVPDLAFQNNPKIKNLFIDKNKLQNVSQYTFVGLENTLTEVSLQLNKISTIDECVFHDFKSLNILKLRIEDNPLVCDCKIKWLYDRVKVLLNNQSTNERARLLQWKCSNLGINFIALNDDVFSNCSAEPTVTCESFIPTFTEAPFNPTLSPEDSLEVFIEQITSSGFIVKWVTGNLERIGGYHLRCWLDDDGTSPEVINVQLPTETNEYLIEQLSPDTAYKISVTTLPQSGTTQSSRTVESFVKTLTWGEMHKATIIGASVGGALSLLLLTFAIFCICVTRRNQLNRPKVEVTDHSKRYVKSVDYSSSTARRYPVPTDNRESRHILDDSYNSDPADVIKTTLQSMTDEEKYRLASLLTNSRNSLDVLDDNGTSVYDKERRRKDYDGVVVGNKHIYEEIPNNNEVYDEINEDKVA